MITDANNDNVNIENQAQQTYIICALNIPTEFISYIHQLISIF